MATLKEKLRARALRLPIWFHVVLNVGALGLALTWWVTYTGLYRWFAERQLDWSGRYELKFTGIMVILVCVISAAVVTQIAASFVSDRSDSERESTAAAFASFEAFGNWMNRNTYMLAMVGATLGLAIVAAYMMIQARVSGRFVAVTAEALERGGTPAGDFASLEGRQLWDDAVTFEKGGGDASGIKTIVPVVSAGWQPGQPVAVFVRLDDKKVKDVLHELLETQQRPALSGLLTADDLDGIARTELEAKRIAIAGRHFVLDQGVTPEDREGLGKVLLGCAGVFAPILLVVWLVKRRRRTRD